MNIQFNTLEIDDFQSIGHAKVDLDNKGICLVKGINNYEENTSSNGSGKSSVFEALYFSLFGKTTNGITNVSNRYTGRTYKLTLDFILDNVKYQIQRDGTKVTVLQNDVDVSRKNKLDTDTYIRDNILKISPEVFLNIIYLAQGFKSRLSALTAGGRKDQIEEIIGTNEITEEFRLQIQGLKEKLEKEHNELLAKKSYNEGSITQINSNIEKYTAQINRILEERKNQPNREDLLKQINNLKNESAKEEEALANIGDEINKIKEENSSKQLELANIDNEIISYQSKINEAKNKLAQKQNEFNSEKAKELTEIDNAYKEAINNSNHEISLLNVQISNSKTKISSNEREIETLKTSDTCPTCGRKLENADETHIKNEIDKLVKENEELEKQIKEDTEKIEAETQKIGIEKINRDEKAEVLSKEVGDFATQIGTQLEELDNTFDKFKQEKETGKQLILSQIKSTDEQTNLLNLTAAKIRSYDMEIKTLEDQLNNIKEESTENYENMIKECNTQLIEINKQNEQYDKSISEVEEKIGVATHSASLVSKEFKNYLLKSAIEFLNSRLDYYSSFLFSNEEDKVKLIQDGTKLDIYLGDALFESLSGGEKRKVDIAIMLVQKELANNMSNTYSNILIMDEVFDGLDSKSIDIVTSILMQVSKDVNSMFMVSHKDTTIGYDSQIIVTKGKDRVSTVESY